MLKIKENKIKELKNFEFKSIYGFGNRIVSYNWNDDNAGSGIIVDRTTREIKKMDSYWSPYCLNKLYDLIKADMVEKAED